MALRAFLFSSDGTATSELCHLLTELGVEAEICSEMLVAVERVTKESFDAIVVDWDLQADSILLIKSLRDLKSHTLILALVQSDAALPEALQAGANSAIRKPIDPQQAQDTLSTAKQLMLARQNELREKQARLAAIQAATAPDNAELPEAEVPQPSSPRPGFLHQNASRSALEAEEAIAKPEPAPEPPPPPPPDPDVRARALKILGYGPKEPEGPNPSATRPPSRVIDFSGRTYGAPHDSAGVFSSLPESSPSGESDAEEALSRPRYGLYALFAAVLLGGVLWVFAPGGDSYVARLKQVNLRRLLPARRAPAAAPAPAVPESATPVTPNPKVVATLPKPPQPVAPDPEITAAEDDASAGIQVIENKPIPAPGAQLPPSDDGQPDPNGGQSPSSAPTDAASSGSAAMPQDAAPPPTPAQPMIQPVSAPVPQSAAPQPPAPGATTHGTGTPTPLPGSHAPADATPGIVDERSGLIIPDSLKNPPGPPPASSLEPVTVPEETSRNLVVKRVEPLYPPQAVQQKLDGIVVLQVHVARDGTVRDVKLVRGYFVLGRAAFDAVKQWRFRPYTLNGKAIDFQTSVTVSFKLPS
jgi:protein TonB